MTTLITNKELENMNVSIFMYKGPITIEINKQALIESLRHPSIEYNLFVKIHDKAIFIIDIYYK